MNPKHQSISPSEAQIRSTLGSVGRAFFDSFPSLREVQLRAIPPIAEGANILVCSATASGKTEALIAPLIWRIRKQSSNEHNKIKGTKFLAIAPTRALVSDLLKRLNCILPQFGWSVGAQTSDHHDAIQKPDALITTPESLDSMLVHGFLRENGEATSHLLAGVEAVFVDEAHLFDCSVRGDQVLFLLERLRRLKQTAVERNWIHKADIQICGASATVFDADDLAIRMLGKNASALHVSGARDLLILNYEDEWLPVEANARAIDLLKEITIGANRNEICSKLVKILRDRQAKKVLMFCPSRAMCDELGEFLTIELKKEVEAWVGTHHGSLEGVRRRDMEKGFAECNGVAVLVATATLEVGVDIGDVDVVALVGPPPDVPSFLQRIGRGGRRGSGTKVIPLAENHEHAAALAGMLVSAVTGDFTGGKRFRNWGVFVQQCASYIMQNASKGRPKKSLLELAEAVWPEVDTSIIADEIIDDLNQQSSLFENRSRYFLAGAIIEMTDEKRTSTHSNIRAGGIVIPVRNRQNGEIIGHVAAGLTSGFTNVGGRRYKVVSSQSNELVVSTVDSQKSGESATASARYPTVPFLISRRYCREVAKGVGLRDEEAPLTDDIWWHFGGQAIEKLLCITMPDAFSGIALKGIALRIKGELPSLSRLFRSEDNISRALASVVNSARSRYSRSSFDDFLSEEMFTQITIESLQPSDIVDFLQSRRITQLSLDSQVGLRLALLLS